jgi:L-histidine Nalpha-methyltransferase
VTPDRPSTVPPVGLAGDISIDVHLDADYLDRALRSDVSLGLAQTPKTLPPKWFYDEAGSKLFDQITRLPEYYPTEREREILQREAANIVSLSGADVMVELGSGTSDKTRTLLEAFDERGGLRCFVPFDVSEAVLRSAAANIAHEFPGLDVHAVVGDFEHHLDEIPANGKRMFVFLGGTIGNFAPVARDLFLRSMALSMSPGDSLLLGTDLVKDVDRLELAYNDPAGITEAFNKNVLAVINRELDADFDQSLFSHTAFFDSRNEWMDLRLRANQCHTVNIADLDMTVEFEEGEELHTEISAKFRPEGIRSELADTGFAVTEQWTDASGDFLVTLAFLAPQM